MCTAKGQTSTVRIMLIAGNQQDTRTLQSLNGPASQGAVKAHIEFRLEFFNLLNRHYYGNPNTNMNNTYFGNVRAASGSRTGQAGLRVDW